MSGAKRGGWNLHVLAVALGVVSFWSLVGWAIAAVT